jgi:hypothetical protein
MTLETVKSSSVYALGYDDERGVIAIVWKGYEYKATREEFEAVKSAPRVGKAVAELATRNGWLKPKPEAQPEPKRPADTGFAVTGVR